MKRGKKVQSLFFTGKIAFFCLLINCPKIVKKHCGPLLNAPWHFSCSIKREKIDHKLFFTGKNAFIPNIAFSENLLCPKKCSYVFQSICQNSLWTLINWYPMFVTLDDTRKNNFLSSWKQLFLKCLFLSTLYVPKKRSYHLHNISKKTLWTLIICCLTYVMCDNTRKSRPKFFITVKISFLFKTFFFQQPIRS